MSNGNNNPRRRRPKKKGQGQNQGQNKGGNQQGKKRNRNKKKKPKVDPNRPFWENPEGEAEVQKMVDSVRPTQYPTALVKSLGEPPLGKFASNAQHYYDAVYEKAQHFAVAMATANGLLVVEDGDEQRDEDAPVDATAEADDAMPSAST